MELLSIGPAIEAAKAGKRIAREGWNGSGMFVFHQQVPAPISPDIVQKMQSLPDIVKAEFDRRSKPILYSNQFGLVKPDNTINGWAPSSADTLAEDWIILD